MLNGQPTITSFTPVSGPIGTSVTITGTNFDTTPSNNIVFFGATQAQVSAATTTELTVTVSAGSTYQPVTVLANGLQAYSGSPFVVTFSSDGTGIDVSSFASKVDFATGTNPWSVAMGDLDGDGHADLAVVNSNGNTVSVFRNTSTGLGSISYAAKEDFATGAGPYSVSIGDLDNDGKADLAVANSSVSVLRNTSTGSGDISFATKIDYTIESSSYSISIGDFDNDGKADLAAANTSNGSVSVYRNTSTGAGSISFAAKSDFTTGTDPISVSVGDFDTDGKLDLAVANSSSNTVSLLRNTSTGAGNINYATKVDFATGTEPNSVSVGDFDEDGKMDLAVVNYSSGTISVLRNTSTGAGSVSYATKVDYTTDTGPKAVSIGDLDGDGRIDLASANSVGNSVSVLKNTSPGSGTVSFSDKVDFSTGAIPVALFMGDADNDGKPDLAVANNNDNTVSVLRNDILSPPAITSFSPSSGPVGTEVTISGTNFDTTPANNTVFFGATKTTVTAASGTELTVTVPAGATYQHITVLTNELIAYSATPFVVTFDSDRDIDAGSFEAKVDFATGTTPNSVAISDIDGDGLADLAAVNYDSYTVSVFRNISSGPGSIDYDTRLDYATGTEPISVSIGDLDGDGKSDLALTNYRSHTVSVFRNTSTVGSISYDTRVDYSTGSASYPQSVSIGDLDGDGRADLAVANSDNHTVSIFRNISPGAGTISYDTKVDYSTGANPKSVSIGDLDGDGKAELAVANSTDATVSVLRNTSTGAGTISYAAKVDFAAGSTSRSVSISDMDGDGRADLAVANSGSGSVSILRNTSPGASTISFDSKVDYATGASPFSVSIGDLNGDGMADLAVSNSSSSTASVFENTSTAPGTISFADKVDFATGSAPRSVSIGDLDNDGKADVVTANLGGNTLSIFRNALIVSPSLTYSVSPDVSTAVFSGVTYNIAPEETSPRGLAFNNDGTKMYVVGIDQADVNEYILGSAYDVSTASFNTGFSVGSQDNSPEDIVFNDDGTKMYIVGFLGTSVYEYALGTAFDVSTASYVTSFSVASEDGGPAGVSFNNSGTKMFVIGWGVDNVYEYTLSNAFDVSSAGFSINFSVSSEEASSRDLSFSKDGTRMYVLGGDGLDVNEYALSEGFNISTATFVTNYSVADQETEVHGLAFNNSGTKMYVTGGVGDDVNVYDLSSNAFNEAATNDGIVEGSLIVSISNDTFINAGGSLTSPTHFTIDNLPSGLVPSMAVAADGLTATLTLTGNTENHDDVDDITDLQFTFTDAAFAGGDASIVNSATGASSNLGIDFNDDLIAYYPFTGNATDESGHGLDGTVSGATLAADRFGNTGSAYNFDGVDDFIQVPTSPQILNTSTNQFTFAGWIYSVAGDGTTSQNVFEATTATSGTNNEVYFEASMPGTMRFGITDDSNGEHLATSRSLELNTWYFVVGTYDGSEQKIYINGELDDTQIWTDNFTINSGIYIGKDIQGGQLFNGIIDDLRIFNRAVPATEIADLYNENGWADREALMALYNSTDGANWTNNTNWGAGFDLSTWYGVTVDMNGNVSSLILRDNNLIGTIPSEIGYLSNMSNLTLDQNGLTGSVPSELGNLNNLTSLNLSINALSGSIPTELANISNLQSLLLYSNNLSGGIPVELGSMPNLASLDLESNSLTGEIPSELSNLTNLNSLNLGSNELSGSIPTWVADFTNLHTLILSGNNLTGTIPVVLGNLSNLGYLNLGGNQLTGEIPTELGNLSNLEILYLYTNQLSGSIPTELGNLSSLSVLNLKENNLSGGIPPGLGDLTSLEELILNDNKLSGTVPEELGNPPNLEYFEIQNNSFQTLPDFSSAAWTGTIIRFSVQNNVLGFDDIIPNIGINNFNYSPQNPTDSETTSYVVAGNNYTMTVSETAPNTSFQWQKDGVDIDGATANSYTIIGFSPSDEGIYTCVMTNSSVQGLTLTRNNITLMENTDLVAYYPFDGNAADGSGHGNNGTVTGAILTVDRFGNENSAYSFDGVDDLIEISATSSIAWSDTYDFSVLAWVKPSSVTGRTWVISADPASNGEFQWRMSVFDGVAHANIDNAGNAGWDMVGNTQLSLDSWNFIGYTYNGSTKEVRIYMDGQFDTSGTSTISGTAVPASFDKFILGAAAQWSNPAAEFFNGSIDDIKVFNRLLSDAEIMDLYTEGGWGLESTYHVSTAGDDSNDGSITSPFRNIQTALTQAGQGYVIKVAAGAYDEGLITQSQVTLLGGYSENFLEAERDIFSNKTVIRALSAVLLTDDHACTIDGFVFDGNNTAEIGLDINAASSVSHNIVLDIGFAGVGIELNGEGDVINNVINTDGETGIRIYATSPTVKNNIIYNNAFGISNISAEGAPKYNCVAFNTYNYTGFYDSPGIGDISLNPRFVDTSTDDYRLLSSSPAIDAGDPTDPVGDEPDPNGGRINMGAYGGTKNAQLGVDALGIVAYYLFNGDAVDESGNGLDGTVNGATLSTDRFGGATSAYSFDGVDDYIDVADDPSLNFGTGDFSISVWARTGSSNAMRIVAKSDHDQDNGYQLGITNSAVFYLLDIGPGNDSGDPVNDDAWHHIVGVREGNDLRLYVDGELADAVSGVASYDVSTSLSLKIGRRDGAQPTYFEGSIDDIRIYDRAITAPEVSDLYGEGGWPVQGNNAPTDLILSSQTIAENQVIGTLIGSLSTTDSDTGDSHTYSLVTGTGDTDNSSFSITNDQLLSAEVFDFETKSSYSIRIRTDDGNGGIYEKVFTITVTDINEGANNSPTDITLSSASVFEEQLVGTEVGTLGTTDIDAGDTHTYSLVAGTGSADNGSFSISGDRLLTAEVFDFETRSSYDIRIQTDDGNGGTFEKTFTITVIDINETGNNAPTDIQLSNQNVSENPVGTTFVGNLSTVDADAGDMHTYSFAAGTGDADNSSFSINNDQLLSDEGFDFETKSSYSIRIQTDDGNGGVFAKEFTITVIDVNESPTDITLSNNTISANSGTTVVGILNTEDPDAGESHTYSFVTGDGDEDNGSFTISGNQLKTAGNLTADTYFIRIASADRNQSAIEESFGIEVVEATVLPTDISYGIGIENYRILSFPFSQVGISEIFGNAVFGEAGDFWLLGYTHPGPARGLTSGTSLRAGEGYWFIAKEPLTITIPSGSPAPLNDRMEFELSLDQGWNLVGNPFLAALNWPGIVTYNENQNYINTGDIITTSGVHQYANGGYSLVATFDEFEGGWVETSAAVTVYIPSPTVWGRMALVSNQPVHDTYVNSVDDWQILINIESGKQKSNLAGIGMHPESDEGFDLRDVSLPPKISDELKFELLEYYSGLTKNIVSPSPSFEWIYDINVSNERVNMTWDREISKQVSGDLLIYFPGRDVAFDMKDRSSVSALPSQDRQMKIFYGDDAPLEKLGIQAQAYPNPMNDEITFRFYVFGDGENKEVTIETFSVEGSQVNTIKQTFPSGHWATCQWRETQMPSGIYLYRVSIDQKHSELQRIIKLR